MHKYININNICMAMREHIKEHKAKTTQQSKRTSGKQACHVYDYAFVFNNMTDSWRNLLFIIELLISSHAP